MAAPISKEEYLKRYTSGATVSNEVKKKKKRRPKEKVKHAGYVDSFKFVYVIMF